MAVPRHYNTFAKTGWRAQCLTAYSTSGGVTIAAPGPGKAIVCIGLISFTECEIKSGGVNSADIKFSMDEGEPGAVTLPGAVSMGEDKSLDVSGASDDVTIFYYIHDINKDE